MHLFRLGAVLGTSVRIWVRTAPAALLLTALFYAPIAIWAVLLVQGEPTYDEALAQIQRYDLVTAFMPLLNSLASAGIAAGVVKRLGGAPGSIWSGLGDGLARIVPALGIAALTAVAVITGLLMLLVPGVLVMCVCYVAIPAEVIERRGTVRSIVRSRELTGGHLWQIFAILLLVWVVHMATSYGLEHALRAAAPTGTVGEALRRFVYADLSRLLVVGSFAAVIQAVAYEHLRREKDGASPGELAGVFA